MKISWSSDPNVAERQMQAVIFCLVAFAYIDADFDRSEKAFIKDHIRKLCEHRAESADADSRADIVARWCKHYEEVLDEMDRDILSHFTESVVEGETSQGFVLSKLKLGCFELFKSFDDRGREELLATIDELIHADGVVHPNEESFRADIQRLLDDEKEIELDEDEIVAIEEGQVIIDEAKSMHARQSDHPMLSPFEWDYASDPDTFKAQSAGDMDLVRRVRNAWDEQRKIGNGKLRGAPGFNSFFGQPPFLDQHVYVLPANPAKSYELLVIGDLHGCYSCLKAALMQSGFLEKVERYQADPDNEVAPYLVFLGDYIDRGRFSYSGTMRAVMQLCVNMPNHVFMLRGNHEYYVEIRGQVLAPVRPSEAMDSLKNIADKDVLAGYMNLFEEMPTMLIFDKVIFVHGGIPRDATVAEKWEGLHTLNDKELRFEMMWSDPSDSDVIPDELQRENARFPFGRKQFQRFMATIGCNTMVRGHERVKDGFKRNYDDPEGKLLTLFSAGGKTNADLPERSNYREVTPMALSIKYAEGVSTFTPFALDYAKYNDPQYNRFFQK